MRPSNQRMTSRIGTTLTAARRRAHHQRRSQEGTIASGTETTIASVTASSDTCSATMSPLISALTASMARPQPSPA